MMDLMVTGPRDGKVDLGLSAMAHLAVENFAKQLGIHRLATTIHLRLHHNIVVDEGCEGLCEPIGTRAFIIDVALYGNWLSTLAHEMVHVRQFARKELDAQLTQWKSNKYCGDIEYWDQPWEKEARRLQDRMLEEFNRNP
tara:strand:- start:423 stop:842 length:420 start_codon:yes stop_codon:yes gene_type:complete